MPRMTTRKRADARRAKDKIERIVATSGYADLTPETLLSAYREEGITTLDALATRLVAAVQHADARPRRASYGLAARSADAKVIAAIRHPVPRIAFTIDGIEYDPKDIARFHGRELLYIATQRKNRAQLEIVAEASDAAHLLRTLAATRVVASHIENVIEEETTGGPHVTPQGGLEDQQPEQQPPGPIQWPYAPDLSRDARMWSDANFGGTGLTLYPGKHYWDLTACYRFWPFTDWNDCISSLRVTTSYVQYAEHIHLEGSKLITKSEWRNLEDIGWNDRISSVINWG